MEKASKIILGTVQFGMEYGINNAVGKPSPEQVFEMLEYASSQDVHILDTADTYGDAIQLLGEYNKTHENTFAVNTKFRSTKQPIITQLLNSLEMLHIKTIDTYYFHNYTDIVNSPEIIYELVLLKQDHLIRKIGASIYDNNE